MHPTLASKLVGFALAATLGLWPAAAFAWELAGTKQITLRTRDGATLPIGTVTFTPNDAGATFKLALDQKDFHDFFLSMREFKCLEGPELQCYVPYPYANPGRVKPGDLAWLEHSLIFFYKAPADYGAKLSNGLYYSLQLTDAGLIGTPYAIDLNDIAAPPSDPSTPPFDAAARNEIEPKGRWIEALIIR